MFQRIGNGKIVLIALLFIASPVVRAQEVMGVKVGGPFSTFDSLIKDKGCTVLSPLTGNTAMYSGVVGSYDVQLIVCLTPKTKQVYKVVLSFEENGSFSTLNNQFEILVGALTTKYGNPSGRYNYFEDPYELGDGFEMNAVRANKCHYWVYWDSVFEYEWSIMIKISSYERVAIYYESTLGTALFDQETDQLLQDGL